MGDDYWLYVVNKTDFIKPNIKENIIDENIYDFENENINFDKILDGDRYDRMYEIYIENKRIDAILDDMSDNSSDYSDDY